MAPQRDRRPGFSRRAQYGLFLTYVLAVAGAIVGAVLLVLSTFNPPAFAAVRSAVSEATAPISATLGATIRVVAGVPETIGRYFRVHGENTALRVQAARDRAVVLRARTLAYENLRLRRIALVRDASEGVVVTARLVSSTGSSTRRFGLLYAGSWQGVRDGQPVRGPNGLIGRVVEVGPNTARVLLVIDPESIVPVRRARDGRAALVGGRGDGMLDIRPIDSGDPGFRAGDLFVTSGTGGIYTPGVPVATIVSRNRDAGVAKPVASAAALDFAVVTRAYLPPPPPTRPAPLP